MSGCFRFSLNRFPQDGVLKDSCGLPWGCSIQPFANRNSSDSNEIIRMDEIPSTKSEDVARCENCFGYINPYATFYNTMWKCPLCNNANPFTQDSKYATMASRSQMKECKEKFIELRVDSDDSRENNGLSKMPIFIALVDISGDSQEITLIKEGLLASIEALPQHCYFGMITFSDKIGIYNFTGNIPHCLNILIPSNGEDCSLGFDEVLDINHMFVQISENSSKITSAIESLCASDHSIKNRGFGTAISSLIDFLSDACDLTCGVPNYGKGILKARDPTDRDINPQTLFYKEQGQRAAKSGACIDIYVITSSTPRYVGISSIKFLAIVTAGNINVYENENMQISALPQDLYRHLNKPIAFNGLLRIRTSPPFKPAHSFGNLFPDENYEMLYHVPGCDPHKSFSFDFEFTSPSGFLSDEDFVPTIQLAFAYSFLPLNEKQMQRRLRIQTIQLPIATTRSDLFGGADSDCILSLLVHKVIRTALDEGISEGRLLLEDWMTILLTNYNNYLISYDSKPSNNRIIDTSFAKHPNLKNLCRLVYSLIKNPMLSADHPIDSDYWNYLHCLYSGLDPHSLRKAIYPFLSSWGAVNNLSTQNIPLSFSSVMTSGCKLFLMDAFFIIVAYFNDNDGKSEGISFPPPKDSLMRNTINKWKQERFITPKLLFITRGTVDEPFFSSLLIEEQTKFGPSYGHFIEHIEKEVAKLMDRS